MEKDKKIKSSEKVKLYTVMVREGEEDIKKGNLHSSDEVKQYIKNWKIS